MARCRLSKGLSSAGSITGSRPLPALGFFFDRHTSLPLPWRNSRFVVSELDNTTFRKRSKIEHQKGNQSYLAKVEQFATFSLIQRRKKGKMKLEINIPVSGLDLASLLDGEQGLFLCQNRGQNYITVAKAGHSIAFGPTPIGKPVQEQVAVSVGPEPWFVTKISNATEHAEFRSTFPSRESR